MPKIDRRILKSQQAIKKAFIELMSETSFDQITILHISDRANVSRRTVYLHFIDKYDLLDKLIEEHIEELRSICEAEVNNPDGTASWFTFFESHYSFFSTMLASKGAPFFRDRFLAFVIDDIKKSWPLTESKTNGVQAEVVVPFIAAAYVGLVEWWFANEMPYPPHEMEQQVNILLEKNLS